MLERTNAFLAEREAENKLILGIAARLQRQPDDGAVFCAVEDDGAIVTAAVQAKKWNIVITSAASDSIEMMVRELAAKPPIGSEPQGRQAAAVPGVSGPAEA